LHASASAAAAPGAPFPAPLERYLDFWLEAEQFRHACRMFEEARLFVASATRLTHAVAITAAFVGIPAGR
jgi:hypothetical protein